MNIITQNDLYFYNSIITGILLIIYGVYLSLSKIKQSTENIFRYVFCIIIVGIYFGFILLLLFLGMGFMYLLINGIKYFRKA